MMTLRTLLLQADVQWNAPVSNRERLERMLETQPGAFDLAVMPETFTTGFLGDAGADDEGMDGPTVEWMHEMAVRHDCAMAGSLVISEQEQRFNRFLFVTPEGVAGFYDKRHLFTRGGEDDYYTAGTQRVIIPYQGWRINLQVCFDLRFPAWCRNRNDYDLLLLVANWPVPRIHHWSTLLEARAIENQSWVIGLNRVGRDGNEREYPGCSVVHGPMGETLVKLGDKECSRLVELNLEEVRKARSRFPFQEDADQFVL
ncbi:MAG: amidohydrolase [Xanthomonadales bacterium]|jgi:predicted amidohydrolase|nr:amidohydrolase [Xanthomonadales bacterium]